ncbi:carbohydrate ABC transporter permease [Saliphagus sp. GCM10025317]
MSTSHSLAVGGLRERFPERWKVYLFILPALLAIVVMLWLPIIRGIYISFFEWPLRVGQGSWVGLDNYTNFIASDAFVASLRMTILMALMAIPQLIVGVVAALAVYHTTRLKDLVSTTFLLPFVIPPVASGTILYYFLEPNFGPFFTVLTNWGLIDTLPYWRQETWPAILVVLGSLTWTYWPWVFIIILARRQSVSDELYESAKVYGANRLQMFRYITYPHLKGAILFVLIFRVVQNMLKTAQTWQLTRGGPGYDTSPLSVTLFDFAFTNQQMGRAAAVGILTVLVVIVAVLPLMWWFERTASEQEGVA